MLNRSVVKVNSNFVFTEDETRILANYSKDKFNLKNLNDCILQLAKLGGYLARRSDPPPGNMVLWRGLNRLSDIQIGYNMAIENCG